MDSQLVYAEKMAGNQPITIAAATLVVPAGAAADANGFLHVDITATVSPALLAEIVRQGGVVISSLPPFNFIRPGEQHAHAGSPVVGNGRATRERADCGICNASSATANHLVLGMPAFSTKLHALPAGSGVTESRF
jgi:hypothetical protein